MNHPRITQISGTLTLNQPNQTHYLCPKTGLLSSCFPTAFWILVLKTGKWLFSSLSFFHVQSAIKAYILSLEAQNFKCWSRPVLNSTRQEPRPFNPWPSPWPFPENITTHPTLHKQPDLPGTQLWWCQPTNHTPFRASLQSTNTPTFGTLQDGAPTVSSWSSLFTNWGGERGGGSHTTPLSHILGSCPFTFPPLCLGSCSFFHPHVLSYPLDGALEPLNVFILSGNRAPEGWNDWHLTEPPVSFQSSFLDHNRSSRFAFNWEEM